MSRKLSDLDPHILPLCQAHLEACAKYGIEILVTCTYRTQVEQNALYAQGRTTPGRIVTNARAGESMHNYRLAYDVVPIINGKPLWSTSGSAGAIWEKVGELGEAQGLEWAGRWKRFREMPHFQFTGNHSLHYFMAGGRL